MELPIGVASDWQKILDNSGERLSVDTSAATLRGQRDPKLEEKAADVIGLYRSSGYRIN
jgi:hypothetical protein